MIRMLFSSEDEVLQTNLTLGDIPDALADPERYDTLHDEEVTHG